MAKLKTAKKTTETSQVLYPEVHAVVHGPDNPITVQKCKDLLGWEAVEGDEYLFKDRYGDKIVCKNNANNRPLYTGVYEALAQEHLRKRWRLNGEPIIVGRTGTLLNGQHTLISVVIAEQERLQDAHWEKEWSGEITMQKVIVYGIDDSDDVVNTMDTCKPRSLADVIYRSDFFKKEDTATRKKASRMTDHAIRLLWDRTGTSSDPYSPVRTHAEALDFLNRHNRLLKCVKHIMEENTEGRLGVYIPPSYAAGLLYLMACSSSDPVKYKANPSEKRLDFANWDKAQDFWTLLATRHESTDGVRAALGMLANADDGRPGSIAEKASVLAKAWPFIIKGRTPTEADLALEYVMDEDGVRVLNDFPTFGGIDLGTSASRRAAEAADKEANPPTTEEVQEDKDQKRKDLKNRLLEARKKKDAQQEAQTEVEEPQEDADGE